MLNRPAVLITGGLGYLGNAVATRFFTAGYEVHGIGRGVLSTVKEQPFTSWHQSSVTFPELVAIGRSYDAVVHCASNSSVSRAIEDPHYDFEQSVCSTEAVLEFVRVKSPGAKLIYPSSAAVYGDLGPQLLRENMVGRPISAYGYNRCQCELLLRSVSSIYGVKAISIRFFSVYGPGIRKQLLWDAAKKILAGGSAASFFGTGEETRDWIYSQDAADLILRIVESDNAPEVLNGATGRHTTNKEVLELLRDELGSSAEIVFNGHIRPGDPKYYNADASLAKSIGWVPQTTLEDGIRAFVTELKVARNG